MHLGRPLKILSNFKFFHLSTICMKISRDTSNVSIPAIRHQKESSISLRLKKKTPQKVSKKAFCASVELFVKLCFFPDFTPTWSAYLVITQATVDILSCTMAHVKGHSLCFILKKRTP
jgi:hypothetical protein